MYDIFNTIPELKSEAEVYVVENDRNLFKSFYECIEQFCFNNNILIGGNVGISMLVNLPISYNSYQWDLYCEDTFDMAKKLADELFKIKNDMVNTISLTTDIKYKEFTLRINTRIIAKLYRINKYQNVKFVDLITPVTRKGCFTTSKLRVIGGELQLINIYRILYTPKNVSMWEWCLRIEELIYNCMSGSIKKQATHVLQKTGGHVNKKTIEQKIIKNIIANSNNVLLGDYALYEMKLIETTSRLQFISSDNIADIIQSIEKCITKLNFRKGSVTFTQHPLNIPDDFQIIRYTLHINVDKNHTAIADVYNSSSFEMIPWSIYNGIKVGNPWVLLRFLFIDVWMLKLILNISNDNADMIKKRILTTLNNIDVLRNKNIELMHNTPNKLFQLSNYEGVYIDESVAKKKLIKEIGEFYPIYYPIKSTRREMALDVL